VSFVLRPAEEGLRLRGFNNLTKSLRFSLYDFVVAQDVAERESYIRYIDGLYSAENITGVLTRIAGILDAQIISISGQDYEPHGASALMLLGDLGSEGAQATELPNRSLAAHLTKSHLCVHTYPDTMDPKGICSFRVDIDIATCGTIVPLKALDTIFNSFESDVVIIDYTVRGFTRDERGRRVYLDHEFKTIQDFIAPAIRAEYRCEDLVLQRENIWQSKMLRKHLDAPEYFAPGCFRDNAESRAALDDVRNEMLGIFRGWPT